MSPKAAAKSAVKTKKAPVTKIEKKVATAKAVKAAPLAKGGKVQETQELQAGAAPSEDDEDDMAAPSGGSSQGGSDAALAAASSTEMSASFKNFRHHPDMENFYRFIYENDLRLEALGIIDEMQREKHTRKMVKQTKANPN